MLQPFELFKPTYIDRLISLNSTLLVSQSYPRATGHSGNNNPTGILLTDYDNPGLAKIHLNAVRQDRYGAILDLQNSRHQHKLIELLSQDSGYRLFWSVVKSKRQLEARINRKYKDHMKRYIERHTQWPIGRDKAITPGVEVTFGELFIVLKYSGQAIRLKFEEIENS